MVAWTADDAQVITAVSDFSVRIWCSTTGQHVRTLKVSDGSNISGSSTCCSISSGSGGSSGNSQVVIAAVAVAAVVAVVVVVAAVVEVVAVVAVVIVVVAALVAVSFSYSPLPMVGIRIVLFAGHKKQDWAVSLTLLFRVMKMMCSPLNAAHSTRTCW